MSASAHLIALGASHHNTPLEMRERFAVAPSRVPELYQSLRSIPGASEVLILNTCNRLEVYCVLDPHGSAEALEEGLCSFQGIDRAEFGRVCYTLRDADAVRHLLGVAAGIDSQIIGETEIFGQVKAAYTNAVAGQTAGPVLNRVVQKCFQAAKFVRASTAIGEGHISVATVSVDLTEKIFGALNSCRVLVIGTGEVGEKTARAMASRGAATMTVLSRSPERAKALAGSVNGSAGGLEALPGALSSHDIVIGSTSAQEPLVSAAAVRALMKSRRIRPLFFIDLGMPRNFEPALGQLPSVFLYDLDDLARIADENLAARRESVARCRRIVDEKASRIWERVGPLLGSGAAVPERGDLAARGQAV